MITVTFACGHRGQVAENATTMPICWQCQQTQVTHVQARPPRFRGTCSGPFAETCALDPGVVNVTTAGPLPLKE